MRQPVAWVLLAGLAVVVLWFIRLGQPDFPLDDAYIVQHSVDGLLHGGETRFAEATPIHGVTSPVHFLLMSVLGVLMPVAWGQMFIAGGATLLFIAGVFCLAHREGMTTLDSSMLTALSVLAGLSLFHFMNGLETGLAMAAISWTLIAYHAPSPRRAWHGCLLGLLPFIRPELGALSLCLFVRELWALRQSAGSNSRLLPVIGWPLIGSLIPLTFLLLVGGILFSNTMSAKMYFYAEGCLPLALKLQVSEMAATQFLLGLGLAGIGFLGLAVSRYRALSLLFIAVVLIAYILNFPGALLYNGHRYLYLLTPFMVTGWAAFLAVQGRVPLLVARSVLVLAILWAGYSLPGTIAAYDGSISLTRIELAGVSRWIAENLKDDAVILVHDAGYISLHGRQPLVDLVGLKTPSSVAVHRDTTWARCARDPQAIDTIARNGGARYFVVLDDWDRSFTLTASLRATGWKVERADSERGDTLYKIYRITPREGSS